jgi:hypothetical protein
LLYLCGGVCAFTGCTEPLLEPTADGSEATNVGIECHIVAKSDDPKVARNLSSLIDKERHQFAHLIENRNGFNNLVMMCLRHSEIIDDPAQGYSVEAVVEMKKAHETAYDPSKRTAEAKIVEEAALQYAEIVDGWARRFHVEEWPAYYGRLVADGHPMIARERFDGMTDGREWLFRRPWPGAVKELESAFENFRRVCGDLQNVLAQHPHRSLAESGLVAIARFYNDSSYWKGTGPPDHEALDEMYAFYASLVEDLTYELTRAANLVCAVVRRRLDSRFRFEEGVLTLESGPYEDLRIRTHRPEYGPDLGEEPYPGLDEFLVARQDRDYTRGEGGRPTGVKLPGDSRFSS